jgi:hypothetical protein
MDNNDIDTRIAICGHKLTYKGDLIGKIEGQILGPSLLGEYFTILKAEYVPKDNATIAHCGYTITSEVPA